MKVKEKTEETDDGDVTFMYEVEYKQIFLD